VNRGIAAFRSIVAAATAAMTLTLCPPAAAADMKRHCAWRWWPPGGFDPQAINDLSSVYVIVIFDPLYRYDYLARVQDRPEHGAAMPETRRRQT
jgi:hypothetical protein